MLELEKTFIVYVTNQNTNIQNVKKSSNKPIKEKKTELIEKRMKDRYRRFIHKET